MENNKITLVDANGQTIQVDKSDFEMVNVSNKIHDQKFETKVTTFAKDAFKRFCKNKSSVVAAIIIGVLILLSIILPLALPYDVYNSHSKETELPAKLFNAGTGFWDGTKTYKNMPSDEEGNLLGGSFLPQAIVSISEPYYNEGSSRWEVDVVYDMYEATYGNIVTNINLYEIESYARAGLLDYDPVTGQITNISPDCPIIEVISQSGTSYTCNVCMYKYYGYSSMPRFLFGTTTNGNDLLKYTMVGLRTSLMLAFLIAAVCFVIGIIWGSISGYFGGNVDLFMERITDILSGVPYIVVVTLCVLHFGHYMWVFILALCMTGWISTSARTRTQFYRFKGREYVLAARTLGASDKRLIFRHILPNSLGTIVTSSVLLIPGVIFSESTLSYLGLGITEGISFGRILSDNQSKLSTNPVLIMFPAALLALLMISFNLFGNGLRDALNPSLKGSE